MSCDDCTREQEKLGLIGGYFYRWKNANILVIGCKKHVKELFKYLNKKEE